MGYPLTATASRVEAVIPEHQTPEERFIEGDYPTALELIETKTTRPGVAVQVHRRSGKPHYGWVALA